MHKRQENMVRVSRKCVRALPVVALFVLSGCGANAAQFPLKANAANPTPVVEAVSKKLMKVSNENQLESVSGVSYDGTHLKVSVISHGCTSSADFSIKYEVTNNRCGLSIVRDKPDMCRRAPMLQELSLEWSLPENCSGIELFVANPILVTNAQGKMTKRSK